MASSLCITPAQVLVNQYFDKRRSTAFSVANLSRGVASFVMPPIVTSCYATYGFAGGMLLMGAISMHVFIGPAVFRPVKENRPIEKKASAGKPHHAVDKNNCDVINGSAACRDYGTNERKSASHPHEKDTNDILHWELLKDSWFLTFLLSLFTFYAGSLSIIFLVPLCIENGYTTSQIFLSLSLYGIADMVGSLLVGLVLDTDLMRSRRYHVCSVMCMVMGVGAFASGYFTNFTLFMMAMICRGLSVAGQSIRIPVLSDVVGDRRLASGIALSAPAVGLGNFLGPIMGGKMFKC